MFEQLGDVLRDAGYGDAAFNERLGLAAGDHYIASMAPVHARRLADDSPLATLARLFLLALPVARGTAAAAFSGVGLDELTGADILRVDGDTVRGGVRITPYEGLLLMSDVDTRPWPADHVLAPGPTARTLDHFTVTTEVESALDVGTGCGIQALRLAQHAGRVVATDVNPRALEFTRRNAALNGVDNIECRLGSWFDAVPGERFDLVVSNPPFVISPRQEFAYRDGGMDGDGLTEAIVSVIPDHLVDGGVGQVLCNWFADTDAGEPLAARPLAWIDGRGCDAVVLNYDAEDLLDYAARWNEELSSDPEKHGAAIDEWVAYLAGFGRRSVVTGTVTLWRRTGGSNAVAHQLALRPGPDAGAHVRRMLDGLDAGPIDRDRVLRVVDGVTLDQRLEATAGTFAVGGAQFAIPHGAGVAVPVPPVALHVVLALDGERSLAELSAEAAADTDIDARTMEAAAVAAAVDLVAAGMLVPAERP